MAIGKYFDFGLVNQQLAFAGLDEVRLQSQLAKLACQFGLQGVGFYQQQQQLGTTYKGMIFASVLHGLRGGNRFREASGENHLHLNQIMFALHGFGLINIILYGAQGQLMHCWFQAYLNPLSSPLSNQLTQSLHQSCFQENLYATYLSYFANITSLVDSLLSCTVVHRHDEISTTHSLCATSLIFVWCHCTMVLCL